MASTLIPLVSVSEFAKAIELDLALVTQTFAVKAHTGVTKRTPVDTGRARANWQLGIGNIPQAQLETTQLTEPNFRAIDGTKVVYIVNNVDYILPLENGSSKQAPFGMAAITMAELQAEIDTAI